MSGTESFELILTNASSTWIL